MHYGDDDDDDNDADADAVIYLFHSRTTVAAPGDRAASDQSPRMTGKPAGARHEGSVAAVSVLRLVQLIPVFRRRRL